MFKIHQIRSNHRVPRRNVVDTHGAPDFAPDYSTNVKAVMMTQMSILCVLDFYDLLRPASFPE
jgi:hypothetical protein